MYFSNMSMGSSTCPSASMTLYARVMVASSCPPIVARSTAHCIQRSSEVGDGGGQAPALRGHVASARRRPGPHREELIAVTLRRAVFLPHIGESRGLEVGMDERQVLLVGAAEPDRDGLGGEAAVGERHDEGRAVAQHAPDV